MTHQQILRKMVLSGLSLNGPRSSYKQYIHLCEKIRKRNVHTASCDGLTFTTLNLLLLLLEASVDEEDET